jgi:DNA-binding NarL/FixJ family response regulator
MDRLDAAASVLDQSSLTAARGRHAGPLFEWIAELVHGIVLTLDGRLPDAAEQAAGAYRRAVQSEMDFAVALACALQSLVARTRGAVEQALRRAREGLTLARRSGARLALNMLLTEVACNALLLGDLPTASSAIDELDMGGKGVPTDCSAVRWQISVARAWLLWEQGDRHAAVQSMLDYSSRARSVEAWALEAAALHHALRMGSRGATVDRLRELAATGGTATRLFAEHAMALDDGQAIEAVSISFERAGYVLYAAEASARASDLYHAEGRLARSSRAAARAKRLMDLCRGVKTPGLASIRTPDLTERESEIARLAMQALPNREIAHRLVLSVRTVENHLQRVYAKTGATARTELEALVGPFVCEPAMARVPSSPGSLRPRADGTKVRAS